MPKHSGVAVYVLLTWVLVAFAFLLLEIGHPGMLYFLSFSLAGFCALVMAVLDYTPQVQLLVFVLTSLLAIFGLRRIVLIFFNPKQASRPGTASNMEAMVGQKVEVSQAIEPHSVGYVTVHGVHWRAKALKNGHGTVNKGTVVEIVGFEGSHLFVKRID